MNAAVAGRRRLRGPCRAAVAGAGAAATAVVIAVVAVVEDPTVPEGRLGREAEVAMMPEEPRSIQIGEVRHQATGRSLLHTQATEHPHLLLLFIMAAVAVQF